MSAQPSPARVLSACLAASAAAAAPTVLLGGLALVAFPIGFMIAGGHMLIIGLPLYLVLRHYRLVDWGTALTAGFLIGCVPLALWHALTVDEPFAHFPYLVLLIAGICGLIAGATFRAVIGLPVDPSTADETASIFR